MTDAGIRIVGIDRVRGLYLLQQILMLVRIRPGRAMRRAWVGSFDKFPLNTHVESVLSRLFGATFCIE